MLGGPQELHQKTANLLRGDELSCLIKQLRSHEPWRTHRGVVHTKHQLRGNLADPVVRNLDPHIPTLAYPDLPVVMRGGEVPEEDVGRFHVQVDHLVGVQVLQTLCNLRRKKPEGGG